MIKIIDYEEIGVKNTMYCEWTNQIPSITKFLQETRVYEVNKIEPGFKVLVLLEQKRDVSVKIVLLNFTVERNLQVDAFSGTFIVLKAVMLLPE